MDEEKVKQKRVVLKGKNIYKFTELKGRLEADTDEQAFNKIISELHRLIREKDNGKNRFKLKKD